MSNSNHRITDYETVHHLTSRIAHRVFFLKEDERNDFQELMLRVAHFCGLRLLGWCIMENHFHILVYLPTPEHLPQDEVISRYRSLSGVMGRDDLACDFDHGTGAFAASRNLTKMQQRAETKHYRQRECEVRGARCGICDSLLGPEVRRCLQPSAATSTRRDGG